MNFYGKHVLFLGAHPDDIELGCGALLHHITRDTEVLCVTLSDNQKNPSLSNVVDECYKSMATLGVPRERVQFGPFTTRVFPEARQQILPADMTEQQGTVYVHTGTDGQVYGEASGVTFLCKPDGIETGKTAPDRGRAELRARNVKNFSRQTAIPGFLLVGIKVWLPM